MSPSFHGLDSSIKNRGAWSWVVIPAGSGVSDRQGPSVMDFAETKITITDLNAIPAICLGSGYVMDVSRDSLSGHGVYGGSGKIRKDYFGW